MAQRGIAKMRVGFIGLGLMGKPMAGHIAQGRLSADGAQSQPRRGR